MSEISITLMQEPPTLKELPNGDKRQRQITAWYEEFRDHLWRFAAYKNLANRADLEDLIQDVFLELYVHLLKGATIHNPRSWLFKAIQSRAIDKIRKAKRESSHLKKVPESQNEDVRRLDHDLEHAEILKQAFSQLNSTERDILVLRILGLTHKEIAEVLGISVQSVSQPIVRALKKLRKQNH